MACIERGIPSLVEKPIAHTLEAALQLADAVERSGVPVLVGHQRRHSPDIAKARQLVNDGALGRLVAVNAMWMTDKPQGYYDAAWRRQPGGGPLLINLIHDIDCLRFICGEIESVMAFSSNAVRSFEVEDTASVSVKFTNGALGTLLMSDTTVSPYNWDTAAGQALYFPHTTRKTLMSLRNESLAYPSTDGFLATREPKKAIGSSLSCASTSRSMAVAPMKISFIIFSMSSQAKRSRLFQRGMEC